jgi:hypothetical protein
MGKFTINGPFSIAMLVYQRVFPYALSSFPTFKLGQAGKPKRDSPSHAGGAPAPTGRSSKRDAWEILGRNGKNPVASDGDFTQIYGKFQGDHMRCVIFR